MTEMVRALTASLVMVVLSAVTAKLPPAKAGASPSPPPLQSAVTTTEPDAERELLALTNQARAEAGVAPLQAQDGLTQAARTHAAEMAAQQQISHQFPGEQPLSERIAAVSGVHLDRAGENVAYAGSAERVEATLMNSPPHRENMLNPAY